MSWDPDWWRRYNAFLASPLWKAIREEAFDYYGRRCAKCRRWNHQLKRGEWLEVDHLTYVRAMGNEVMRDLQILCNTCHRKKTRNTRRVRTLRRVKRWIGV